MADLAIVVDTKSLVDAKKKLTDFQNQMGKNNSILGLSRALNGVEANVKSLLAAQNKGQLSAKSFNQGLLEQKKALVATGMSFAEAKQKVDQLAAALRNQQATKAAIDAARNLARAQKEAADAHELTRQRYVAGAAAQARLKQAQKDLSAAYRAGVINIDEYRQALILLNQQNQGNLRGTNNLGVAMQQTGYQVGDFVVQVQSGTDPMVAFGQQATQLVGIMYLLPPAVLASTRTILGFTFSISALAMTLGIAIPVLAAVGAAYMRFKKESDKAGQAAESLSEKIKSLDNSLKDYAVTKEALSKGMSLNELFATDSLDSAVKNLERAKKKLEEVSGAIPTLAGQKAVLYELLLGPLAGLMSGSFKSLSEAEKEAVNEVIAARTRLQLLLEKEGDTRARNFAESSAAMTQEIELLRVKAEFGEGSPQDINAELAQELRLRKASIDARVEAGELDENAGAALKLQIQRISDLNVKTKETTALLQQSSAISMLEEQLKSGKESLEVAKLRAKVEGELEGLAGEALETYIQQQLKIGELERDLDYAYSSARAIAGIDFSNIADGATWAGSLAEQLAIARGKALDEAAGGNVDFFDPRGRVVGSSNAGRLIEERGVPEENKPGYKPPKKRTSDSSRAKKEQKDYLKELRQEVELKRSLIGLSEEDARKKELIFELEKRKLPVDLERVKALVAAEVALKKVTEAEERRTKTFDLIEDNMSSAFLSMVDGSKSVEGAFKDMLRNILKHLYEQQVTKPIAEGLSGLLKAGLSGLAGGGISTNSKSGPMTSSPMPPTRKFAVGGVVHRATNFNMMGGGTGQMGEAGPEAIMPLKRGANGKLGVQMEGNSEGNVVVNQTFQFSANGDESVKKLIAQAAPKIAQMTQRQIVDSRRRGGGMKETFG